MFSSYQKTCRYQIIFFCIVSACSFETLEQETQSAKDTVHHIAKNAWETTSQSKKYLFDKTGALDEIKKEIDKIYQRESDYDVLISVEDNNEAERKKHQKRISEMPHLQIENMTIGYEEVSNRSLDGTLFSRHFRATWVFQNQTIGVSYYSKQEIDFEAFIELLKRIAPTIQSYFYE